VELHTGVVSVRMDQMSTVCRVNLLFCESMESRVSRGKILQSMPVALLLRVCRGVWSLKGGLSTVLLRPMALRCQPFEQGLGENDDAWKIEFFLFHGCLTRASI
jgi:hypothetical protein